LIETKKEQLTSESNVTRAAGADGGVITAAREIANRVRLRAPAVRIRASHGLAASGRDLDRLREALDVGDIVCLRSIEVASIKVELAERAALALGTAGRDGVEDAADPLDNGVRRYVVYWCREYVPCDQQSRKRSFLPQEREAEHCCRQQSQSNLRFRSAIGYKGQAGAIHTWAVAAAGIRNLRRNRVGALVNESEFVANGSACVKDLRAVGRRWQGNSGADEGKDSSGSREEVHRCYATKKCPES
jgi:hypothetical protein